MINNLSKLRWACRRGMLELDVLLGNFLEKNFSILSLEDKKRFVQLLESSDPQLFAWLLGYEKPADPEVFQLIQQIKHAQFSI